MRLRQRFSPPVVIASAVLLASALLPLPKNGAILGLPSLCPFHNITGLPCPGCGLTRSFVSMGHGHFVQALVWHPLGPVLFGAALFYVLAAIGGKSFSNRWQLPLSGVAAVALIACWLLRLDGVFPLPGG